MKKLHPSEYRNLGISVTTDYSEYSEGFKVYISINGLAILGTTPIGVYNEGHPPPSKDFVISSLLPKVE